VERETGQGSPRLRSGQALRLAALAQDDTVEEASVVGKTIPASGRTAGPSTARPPDPQKMRVGKTGGRSAQDDNVLEMAKFREARLVRNRVLRLAAFAQRDSLCEPIKPEYA